MPDFKLNQVTKELEKMAERHFYGEFNIKFVQGQIVQCKRVESLNLETTSKRISISESST